MAIGASILRSEVRRHLLMNVGLVASCVVGATVVTNERGLFVPITADMSDTSRAFAAMFTQSRLLPDHEITNVQMVTPLAPFEVTADSRDLRRRLMDALSSDNDPTGAGGTREYSQNASQMPALDNQVLSLNGPGSAGTQQSAAGTGGSGGSGGGGGSQGASSTTVASTTAPTSTSTSNSTTPPLTVASNSNNPAASQSSQGVSDGSAISSDGGTTLGSSTGTDQTGTGPAAVPEPSVWAMLIAGFGMIGFLLRSNRKRQGQPEADAAA